MSEREVMVVDKVRIELASEMAKRFVAALPCLCTFDNRTVDNDGAVVKGCRRCEMDMVSRAIDGVIASNIPLQDCP